MTTQPPDPDEESHGAQQPSWRIDTSWQFSDLQRRIIMWIVLICIALGLVLFIARERLKYLFYYIAPPKWF